MVIIWNGNSPNKNYYNSTSLTIYRNQLETCHNITIVAL